MKPTAIKAADGTVLELGDRCLVRAAAQDGARWVRGCVERIEQDGSRWVARIRCKHLPLRRAESGELKGRPPLLETKKGR